MLPRYWTSTGWCGTSAPVSSMRHPQLNALEALVPPPASPTAAGEDFARAEEELGTRLPTDWKSLVSRYGCGTFGDFFHLWSPFFAPCPMVSQACGALDADRELSTAVPEAVPFPLHPDPQGALPWGNTDNGDVAYWLMRGDPDRWPAAVWNPRGGSKYDLVEGGAAALLATWLAGKHGGRLLPKDAPRCFDPWRERKHFTIELNGDSKPFAERLQLLVSALSPVQMRGAFGSDEDEGRQVHFVCEDGAWKFTYDTLYGHNLRAAVPPHDVEAMQARVRKAVAAMGCRITKGS